MRDKHTFSFYSFSKNDILIISVRPADEGLFDWVLGNQHSLVASGVFSLSLCGAGARVLPCHKLPFEMTGVLSPCDVLSQ